MINNLFDGKISKLYILLLFVIVCIFIGIGIYYYYNFIKDKNNKNYVDNKEFLPEPKNKKIKEATLYYFYTNWCPHCKKAGPEINKLVEQTGGVINETKLVIEKVDCDKDTETADKFEVNGYPTIKLIYDEKIYDYDAKPNVETLIEFLNTVI